MDVLGMLKQEPGTVKGLLTGSADVAGRLVFICRQRKTTLLSEVSNANPQMPLLLASIF